MIVDLGFAIGDEEVGGNHPTSVVGDEAAFGTIVGGGAQVVAAVEAQAVQNAMISLFNESGNPDMPDQH